MKTVKKKIVLKAKGKDSDKHPFCPHCDGENVKEFEFGDFWCRDCYRWFTREDHVESIKI